MSLAAAVAHIDAAIRELEAHVAAMPGGDTAATWQAGESLVVARRLLARHLPTTDREDHHP